MEPGLCLKNDLPTVITVTQHSAGFIAYNVESMSWKCTLMHVNNLRPYFLYWFLHLQNGDTLLVFIRAVLGKGASAFFLPQWFLALNYSQVKLLPTESATEEGVMYSTYAMRSETPEKKPWIVYSSTQKYTEYKVQIILRT